MKKLPLLFIFIFGITTYGQVNLGNVLMDAIDSETKSHKPIQKGKSELQILKDIDIDLNDFTHVAIVEAPARGRYNYNEIEEILQSSQFEIVNPADRKNKEFKKKFRKNRLFLRNEKNESWLYLSIISSQKMIESKLYITNFVTLRNSNKKVVYKSKTINLSFTEQLYFLINF